MTKIIIFVVVFVLLSVSVMGAGEIIDSQTTINNAQGPAANNDWREAWTTFTASDNYWMQELETVMCEYNSNAATGSFNVNIYSVTSNLPDTVIMSSDTYTKSHFNCTTTGIPTSSNWHRFTLHEAIELSSGTQYAIVFNFSATGVNERVPWAYSTGGTSEDLGNCASGCYTKTLDNQFTFRTTNATPPTPPAPSSYVTFIDPTPPSGSNNNTLVRFAWNTSTNRSGFHWRTQGGAFAKYLDNVTNNNATYAFTANVTADGTYEYFASLPDDNSTNTTVYEWTYDTTEPPITINGNTSFTSANVTKDPYNKTLILNIGVTDNIDLYGFHINVTYTNGTVYHSYTNTSLSGTSYTYYADLDVSAYPTGDFTVNILASDSHTANRIDDYDYEYNATTLTFDTAEGNTIIIRSLRQADWNITKEFDRYTFGFAPYTTDALGKYKFQVFCDQGLSYRQNSGYDGHLVCWNANTKQGNWLDFEGTQADVSVSDEGGGWFEIEVEFEGDSIEFQSLGGLNVNEEAYLWSYETFTLSTPTITPTTPVTVEDVLGFCQATDTQGQSVTYNWRWYKDGALYNSSSSSGHTSGSNINLNNISSTNTNVGEVYVFSCNAEVTGNVTAWKNSTSATIANYGIDDCSSYNTTSLNVNFKIFNGSAKTVNTSASLVYNPTASTALTSNYSFTKTSVNGFSYCITPANASLEGDLTLQYSYDGVVNNYYTSDTYFNSSPHNITLYASGGEDVTATVYDNINTLVSDAYIYVYEYDFLTGNYLLSDMGKTNFEGETRLYLTLDNTYYKFDIYNPLTTLRKSTSPDYVNSNNIVFRINLYDDLAENYFYAYGTTYSLTFNNVTNNFRFTYSDPSATFSGALLKVYKLEDGALTLYNTTNSSSTAGTLLQGITPTNGSTYVANAFYISGDELFLVDSLEVYTPANNTLANPLVLFGILLITVLFAFLFTFSISIGIIAIPIPLVVAASVGLLNVSVGWAISVEIVAVVIAYFVRDRG